MTLTFENDNNLIVYSLGQIISYARENQYIFLAQSIWWISSIIGLQQGLVIYLDNVEIRSNISKTVIVLDTPDNHHIHPSRHAVLQEPSSQYSDSGADSDSTPETDIQNKVDENCEVLLEQSKQERKTIGRKYRQVGRIIKQMAMKKAERKKPVKTFGTQTQGIDCCELPRRKAAGECHRCAWPKDRKGSHKTIDCYRWKRLEKVTPPFPKGKAS
jgi:hypothetical protein